MQTLNKAVHALFLIAVVGGVAFYALSARPANKNSKGTGRTYAQQAEADLQRQLNGLQQQQADALKRSIQVGRQATGR
jgi:hypothetical protein